MRHFTFSRLSRLSPLLAITAFLAMAVPTRADMEFFGGPFPLSDVGGKTGAFRVTLPERSPLSAPKDIIKRMHLKKDIPADDYDWGREIYDVYIPKTPGEGGKYGLMVGAVFKDYGAPPGEWGELLDKYHVIWICSETVGDGQPAVRRIGTMLDAAHNIGKTYPVQDGRLYASVGAWEGPIGGVALHYGDTFDGAMYTVSWLWYTKLPNSKNRKAPWNSDTMTRPDGDPIGVAKTRGRYFFVQRQTDASKEENMFTAIVEEGYVKGGFKYTKLITVPDEQMGHYGLYNPGIFDQAMTFLDAPLSKIPPRSGRKAVAATSTSDGPRDSSATRPAVEAVSSEDAEKASKALEMANNYLALKKYDLARPKLEKIVKDYPDTPAAKQAKALLKALDGK